MITRRSTAAMLVAAGLMLAAACGKQSGPPTAAEATASTAPVVGHALAFSGDPESPYCRAALDWQIVELNPPKPGTPAYVRYQNDYPEFLKKNDGQAPDVIKDAQHTFTQWNVNTLYPVLKKYDYDEERFMKDATEAEKKIVTNDPPENVQKAFDKVLAYESTVCGTSEPRPAKDARYSGSKTSTFCKAEKKVADEREALFSSGKTPANFRTFATSPDFTALINRPASAYPAAIRDDNVAYAEFIRTKQLPVLEKYGYDVARILKEGTADERHAAQPSSPEIRDRSARVGAYLEQVCGL